MTLSNIQQLQHTLTETQCLQEIALLEREKEMWAWNHSYWLKNNERFEREKSEFNGKSDEELSAFYTRYLDENKVQFRAYLLQWWKWQCFIIWKQFQLRINKIFT